MEIGAVVVCAFLIGIKKISLKQSLSKIGHSNIEISPHFLKQLEAYDLEKMAFVSIQREWTLFAINFILIFWVHFIV